MKNKPSLAEIMTLVLRIMWTALTLLAAYGLYATCSYIYGDGSAAGFALVPDIIETTLAGVALASATGAAIQYTIRSQKER